MYSIEFENTRKIKKDKFNLDKDILNKNKIKRFIEKLLINPFSSYLNIKKMQPKSDKKYRLKVDNYRIIYTVHHLDKTILIHRIGLRKDIYK